MARPNRYSTEGPTDYASTCAACRDKNPNIRYAHYLHSAKVLGVDDTYDHVFEDLTERLPQEPERARDYALTIKYWLIDQMSLYDKVVDEHTGAFLPWWEGRARVIDAMQMACEALKNANVLAEQERERRRHVRGFVRLGDMETYTVLREPGDEETAAA